MYWCVWLSVWCFFTALSTAQVCNEPKVKSFLASVSKKASEGPESFCFSYLHYTQPYTTTAVYTTSYVTITQTITRATVTITKTVTKTRDFKHKRQNDPDNERKSSPSGTGTAETGSTFGFPSATASAGCSCIVPKPSKTLTTTTTLLEVQGVYVYTTLMVRTTTSVLTITVPKSTTSFDPTDIDKCNGPNPTFYVQLKASSGRIDAYEGQYLATEPDEFVDSGNKVLTTTASLSDAELLYLDLKTGQLKTLREGWGADSFLFSEADLVYFSPVGYVEQRNAQFLQATISNGRLSLSISDSFQRNVLETCPSYEENYGSPIILGAKEYTDGPVCSAKNLIIIPYCTPKGS